MMTAAARGPRAAGPVTLRDFLELACDSSSDGFRSYPRCLPCTTDEPPVPARLLAEADHLLRRSPSRSPGPAGALARISSLSRSFSRRIKEGLVWRRRDDDDDEDLYFDDRDSCGFPSPLVSSCSASDSESSEYGDVAIADEEMAACPPPSSECDKQLPSSSSPTSSADHDCTDGAAPDGNNKMMQAVADGDPAVGRGNKLGMHQDKQQLSPVSVLDFPFDDDDGDERSDAGTCSPSFQQRCPPPPRTTTKQAQVLHKIRRYDGIAEAVDPVDLEARFTTTSSSDSGESAGASTHLATTSSCSTDTTTSSSSARHGEEHQSADRSSSSSKEDPEEEEEPDEYRLLARLLHLHQEDTAVAAAAVDEVSQVLMLDFFAEGLDRLRSSAAAGRGNDKAAEARVVAAAAEWLRGGGPRWGIRDVMGSGKAALEDMERGRRWMRVDEEERDVGAAVEGSVMDGLLDELVAELVVPSWCHAGR